MRVRCLNPPKEDSIEKGSRVSVRDSSAMARVDVASLRIIGGLTRVAVDAVLEVPGNKKAPRSAIGKNR